MANAIHHSSSGRSGRRKLHLRPGRGQQSHLAIWYWEIDRTILFMVLGLMAWGLLAVAVASPVTAKLLSTAETTLDPLYFFYKQLMWLCVGVPIMLFVSMLPKKQARRFAIFLFLFFFGLLFLVPFLGDTVNGARRWIGYGLRLQPSEFLKPAFAVTVAWILSLKIRDPQLPVLSITFMLTMVIAILLMKQPDFGQTIMFCGIWFVLALLAGLPKKLVIGAFVALPLIFIAAYFFYPVAQQRINGWLFGSGEYDHVMLAYRTLTASGLFGTGPWLGSQKFHLPEAHTDYIFSVIGEEFGLLFCALTAMAYIIMIMSVCFRMIKEKDFFTTLAAAGLIAQLGGQAIINMAVNLQLFPSKGMTLPFISYGGSSVIALSITTGLLLAFTRRNPYLSESMS